MRKAYLLLAFGVAMVLSAFAQVPASAVKTGNNKIDNEFVQRQFGNQFTILPDIQPTFGDLDGDGVEDVAIAARCKNPMLDQGEHDYKVVDPYYDYFGYGDPKMTTTFSAGDPSQRGLVVLIIYGATKDGWGSANSQG